MEKGGGGDNPTTRAAGGMCDRFLTFLARNLTMNRVKSIADGPKNGADGGAAGHPPSEEGEEVDEFFIPIERAEFDYVFGSGHGEGEYRSVATILEESAATTMTTRDVPEPNTGVGAAAVDSPVGPAPPEAPTTAVAVEETKVRKSVTIKEDRPAAEHGGGTPAAPVERKRSLFKKRQASSLAAGDGEPRVPRRSGLRPRMPSVLRVPSNINERSSTFIEERKKSFVGRGAKPAPDK